MLSILQDRGTSRSGDDGHKSPGTTRVMEQNTQSFNAVIMIPSTPSNPSLQVLHLLHLLQSFCVPPRRVPQRQFAIISQVWADMQAAAGSRTGARQIIISRSGTMPTTEAGAWVATVARLYQPQMGCQRPEQLSVVSVAIESMTRYAAPCEMEG